MVIHNTICVCYLHIEQHIYYIYYNQIYMCVIYTHILYISPLLLMYGLILEPLLNSIVLI